MWHDLVKLWVEVVKFKCPCHCHADVTTNKVRLKKKVNKQH